MYYAIQTRIRYTLQARRKTFSTRVAAERTCESSCSSAREVGVSSFSLLLSLHLHRLEPVLSQALTTLYPRPALATLLSHRPHSSVTSRRLVLIPRFSTAARTAMAAAAAQEPRQSPSTPPLEHIPLCWGHRGVRNLSNAHAPTPRADQRCSHLLDTGFRRVPGEYAR